MRTSPTGQLPSPSLSALQEYNPKEDSLRFYQLGSNWKGRVEHFGIKTVLNLDDPMVV